MAFQIQDDVLNLIGDKKKYGKEIGGDILEGKRTLILIDLMNKCSPDERMFVIDSLDRARENKNPAIIDDILKLITDYGSIEFASSVSTEMAKNARRVYLDRIEGKIHEDYRKVITDLIDFMVVREL